MKGPGVTAIAHPAPLDLCTNHGVFVFKDVNSIRKRYDDGKSRLINITGHWYVYPGRTIIIEQQGINGLLVRYTEGFNMRSIH